MGWILNDMVGYDWIWGVRSLDYSVFEPAKFSMFEKLAANRLASVRLWGDSKKNEANVGVSPDRSIRYAPILHKFLFDCVPPRRGLRPPKKLGRRRTW
jgi:hypothetical protein